MTREDARKALERIVGTKVRLEVEQRGEGHSSEERRAAAKAEYDRVFAEYEAARAEYERILREHEELQRLAALRKALFEEQERLNRERHSRKFHALKPSGGGGWEYIGGGDSWREVIELAKAKYKPK